WPTAGRRCTGRCANAAAREAARAPLSRGATICRSHSGWPFYKVLQIPANERTTAPRRITVRRTWFPVPVRTLSWGKGRIAMATQSTTSAHPSGGPADNAVPPVLLNASGLTHASAPISELTEKRLDEIEMIGEGEAAGLRPPGQSEVSAGMRFLHSSRTIHQLVADRNRAVGVYLAVASLLWTASGAILNARPGVRLMVPIESIQYWCLPATFAILTVLALFTAFLLIRTRI